MSWAWAVGITLVTLAVAILGVFFASLTGRFDKYFSEEPSSASKNC